MKVAIIVFPGSNCDHDVYYVFKKILGQETSFVWHKDVNLSEYQAIVLPGGFSYGDYLRCGAISRFSPIMKEVVHQAKKGIKVIGICNGFQILTESGLLPGALLKNDNQKFVCKSVYLKVENNRTGFTHLCTPGELLRVPVAHGEGNYYCDKDTLKHLQESGQIIFRYSSPDGEINADANPNGSLNNIAGIINKDGNILGMMPHPERRSEEILGHHEGRKILQSMLERFSGN